MKKKANPEENDASKQKRLKRFIIIELVIGLILLIPAQVLSFYGSTNLIIGILFFLLSVVIARGGQLFGMKKDINPKLFAVIGIILLTIGIIFLIGSGPLEGNGIYAIILGIIGVIIGLRIWILILIIISGDWW